MDIVTITISITTEPQQNSELPEAPVENKSPVPEEPIDKEKLEEYVNHRGIRFTPQDEELNLQPYGLVCVRELFR